MVYVNLVRLMRAVSYPLKVNFFFNEIFFKYRDTVYDVMKALDPHGFARRRGPLFHERLYVNYGVNYLIHLDQYDKIRHWGLCVHGAIDGLV